MLELRDLHVIFHENTVNERVALNGLSATVGDGEFISLIGGNGAGKSTLFSVIAGNILPKSGRVIINNKNITFMPQHKRADFIGRLFQDPMKGTAPNMTIEENLSLAYGKGVISPFSKGVRKENRDLFKTKLEAFKLGLENRLNTKVKLLSGGERQALSLVMATIKPPEILLLDEHTAALDPKTQETVMEETGKIIKEHNLTALMITHHLEEAISYGNKIFLLKGGQIAKIWDKMIEIPKVEDMVRLI